MAVTGKEKEVEAMRNGGNILINKLFEAKLVDQQRAVVRPDKHTELDPRSSFIYDKYQHRKWYDDKLARRKSTFVPPAPIGVPAVDTSNGKRSSGGEFDAFLALRTKDAFHDSWHDSKDTGDDIVFDPKDDFLKPKTTTQIDRANMLDSLQRMNSQRVLNSIQGLGDNPRPSTKKSRESLKDMNHSISAHAGFMTEDDDDLFGSKSPIMAHSARGGLSFTRTPKPDGRENLTNTLQRMDSKRQMLNTIRTFGEDEIILPRKVASLNRRKKNRSPRENEDDEGLSTSRRRDSSDGDPKPSKLKRSSSREQKNGIDQGDTRRRGSNDADPKPRLKRSGSGDHGDGNNERRRGSNDGDARPRVGRSSSGEKQDDGKAPTRKPPPLTKSNSSDDGVGTPRRRVRRTASGQEERGALKDSPLSTSLVDSSHTTGSNSRAKREPRRGMARTKSMDTDSEHSYAKQRTRSRSVKRGVRRSASSDEYSFNGSVENSLLGQDADGSSQISGRSGMRRPPRRPGKGEDERHANIRQLNESISSRHSRHDESRRNRRAAREGNEEDKSRTPSPTSNNDTASSTRSVNRRTRSVPRKPQGSAINVSRVPTVRDKGARSGHVSNSPARAGKSPMSRQRSVDVAVTDDMMKLFAASN